MPPPSSPTIIGSTTVKVNSAAIAASTALPPGNALHLTPPSGSACLNDLRIRWADGRSEERAREDLCQAQRVLRV
ncbi:MAG TPA: hypothetical protein VN329_05420, partial [Roseomonas sp.]|nr:hypothetical protein [Roseomonas sp.]